MRIHETYYSLDDKPSERLLTSRHTQKIARNRCLAGACFMLITRGLPD